MSQRASIFILGFLFACSSSSSGDNPDGAASGTGGGGTGGSAGAVGTGGGGAIGSGGTAAGSGGTAGGSDAATGRGGATGGPDAAPDVSMTVGNYSVLERGNHPSRDNHFVRPALTMNTVARMAREVPFAANFTGSMWANPLFLEGATVGQGRFFAVTTGNDVFALDETTGATVWRHNIGSSPTNSGAGCGSIHPIGIISTPVIDPTTRTIYVAGAIGTATIDRHEVHALSVDDGTERTGWPVDVTTITAGTLQFMPQPHNQRSALSLVGGTLYVAYGGHVGDCGPYHGWVVGIDTRNPAQHGAWATTGQGEGIWAPGGLASDGNGVFAVTGNSTVGAQNHGDSEEVVRVTGLGVLSRTNQNFYYPPSWLAMDNTDADFGAINPMYLSVPGATPANYVVALAKDGHMYMLDAANLGGMGGHVVDFIVSTGNAMSVRTVPTAYTTPQGVHVAFTIERGTPRCPAGSPAVPVVMSVLIPPGSPPVPRVEWCSGLSGTITAPSSTSSDGSADALVWYMSNSRLTAVNGETGQAVWTGTDTCAVTKWTSPIATGGRIVVGGDNHLCSWSSLPQTLP